MVTPEKPILMLMAFHLKNMRAMPPFFWKVRSLAQLLQREPGALKAHRWLSRRSLLLMSWWQDRESAEAWLAHPEHKRLLEWAKGQPGLLGLWVETYQLAPGGIHHGARGAPVAEPMETDPGPGP